jgi:hypothetical protein
MSRLDDGVGIIRRCVRPIVLSNLLRPLELLQPRPNAVHLGRQPGQIPPRPPLAKGGTGGDLLERCGHCPTLCEQY